jgi:hypothetical protein
LIISIWLKANSETGKRKNEKWKRRSCMVER